MENDDSLLNREMSGTELQLRREIQTQEVFNKLLQASLQDLSLERTLEGALECIVSAPLFPMKSKGAIFLVEKEPEVLVMRAQRGLSEYLLKSCARVPFGYCLCGRAAKNRSMVCSAHVDKDHDIFFEGMTPHGHFCVPILANDKLVGVINLYVDDGHVFQECEIEFLRSVGNVLASVIQRRKAEQELKDTQMQLLQAGRLASIGQLAAGVAHEINNPAAFVASNLEVLSSYVDSYLKIVEFMDMLKEAINRKSWEETDALIEEIRKYEGEINFKFIVQDVDRLVQQSREGVSRIEKIISDLKTFAQEDTQWTEDLIKIEDVLEMSLSSALNDPMCRITVQKEYSDTPQVRCNAQKIGQVFLNLLTNAAQAIPDKGTIVIRTYTQNDFVGVDISDTGCGIPEENLNRIFDPFFTTKSAENGIGLGLSISHEFVSKHRGEIRVVSEVGKGTIFTVLLPLPIKKAIRS